MGVRRLKADPVDNAASAPVIQVQDAALYTALAAIYQREGFRGVVRAWHRASKALARANREAVNREGWIV